MQVCRGRGRKSAKGKETGRGRRRGGEKEIYV